MKLVTSRQMRELDTAAIRRGNIPSLNLMERAGFGLAKIVINRSFAKDGRIVVVAGKGNNGGDGLVAARYLIQNGFDVTILLLSASSELSPDSRVNFEQLAPLTTRIISITDLAGFNSHLPELLRASCIVDAIFGTGLEKNVSGLLLAVISAINSLKVPIIAADIPSGLCADTGKPLGKAVHATITATFGLPKIGLYVGEGPGFAGKVEIVDIGIPDGEVDRVDSTLELIEPASFAPHFGKRKTLSHKGTYGHVVVFAGSLGHLGAGYLSCLAALRSGCGLVTYCLPEKAFSRFDARYPEIMCDAIPDEGTARFHPSGLANALSIAQEKNVVAIGPAIGTEKATKEFVNEFVKKLRKPLVIDADGLNVLDLPSVRGRGFATILTPHPGEMARLCGATVSEIQADRIEFATRLAKDNGATVILKGASTVVAMPEGRACINSTGNAGMASAGMGDALTGIVASFIAQGMDIKAACAAGVYFHGLAGDLAVAEHGERAVITSDVIKKLGEAYEKTYNHIA